MKILQITVGIILLTSFRVFAQPKFSFNGQYMNRAEYRHGFTTLAAPDQKPAFFISQRMRLEGTMVYDRVEVKMNIQDVRTWGSTSNLAIDKSGLLSVHEAWLGLQLSNKVKLKMGRQEIKYDEDRIFGNLDWAMQARRHDAALLMYYDSASKAMLHFGFAFNQEQESLAGTTYTLPNNYKTFQYGYFLKPFGNLSFSFLFLNNGVEYTIPETNPVEYKTVFSQTFGPRIVYKNPAKKLSWNTTFYLQTGKNNLDQSLFAYDWLAEVAVQLVPTFSLTAGFELLSGTSQLSNNPEKSKSFTPFYGTNHRFNGYMDYFYVGNHGNSVGLHNFYLKGLIKKEKVFVGVDLHLFNAAADIMDAENITQAAGRNLGTEVDITVCYNFWKSVSLQGGYSQMFATTNMEYLKNVPEGSQQVNNWAYLMVIFRPGNDWPRTGLKL